MAQVKVLASKNHHYFTLNVNEVADSIDIANNTSNVSYSFVLSPKVKNYDWSIGQQITYVISINGTNVYTGHIPSYNGTSTVTLKSDTVTIPHDNDGSKTLSFGFTVTDSTSYSFTCGNASGSGTVDLTTIPRASSFTLSKTSGGTATTSFTLGDNIYANITRASTSFNHKVYFVIGSSGNQVLSNSATTSANTTLASSLATYIPLSSGTAVMYVETYKGSTSSEENYVGTTTATFTISVPSNVVPSITSVTKSDTNSYLTTYGAYVQGKSILKVSTVASGATGSTISNCTVKLKNGTTVLNTATATLTSGHYDATFSNLTTTGTITVEVTVTDSRSRTATDSSTITVASYSNPSIGTFTAERLNNDDTVTLNFNGSFTNINNSGINSTSYKLYKRQSGTSSWGNPLLTHTGSYTYNRTVTETCNGNYAWEFLLEATDDFTSSNPITKTTSVGTAFELINWGSNGTSIAFGKVAGKSNSFECGLDAYISSLNKDDTKLTTYGTNIIGEVKPKNMITGWFYGGLSSTNGSESTVTDARRTGFIEVDYSKVSTYKLSGMPASTTGIRHFVCAYNSSKQFLGRTGGATGTNENLTSSVYTNGTAQGTGDIKYLRVNLYTGASDSSTTTVQLEEGNTATTYYEGKGYGSVFGSNANGFYQKFDDGTLVQWNYLEVSDQAINNAYGSSGLYWGYRNITYPIPFIGNYPSVTCSQFKWGTGVSWGEVGTVTLTTAQLVGIDISSRATGTNVKISWLAIGRWK